MSGRHWNALKILHSLQAHNVCTSWLKKCKHQLNGQTIFFYLFLCKCFFNKRKEASGLIYFQGSLICLLEGRDELKPHAQLFSKSKNRFKIFFTQTKLTGPKFVSCFWQVSSNEKRCPSHTKTLCRARACKQCLAFLSLFEHGLWSWNL